MPWWVSLATALGLGGAALAGAVHLLNSSDHDWRNCDCDNCRGKRYRAHKKRGDRILGTGADGRPIWSEPPQTSFDYMATTQLKKSMVVEVYDEGYLVRGVVREESGDYLVHLTNMRTRKQASVRVQARNVRRKFWKPGYGGH